MIKHTQTIRRLSVFDHFVGLAPKGLKIRLKKMVFHKMFRKSHINTGNYEDTKNSEAAFSAGFLL